MGMRRRRKKLTTVLANLDRGVRSATLKQVKRQTPPSSSDYAEELETTTETAPPVGTQIAVDPPDQWAKVIGGYYYPPTRTGGLGQVELFLSEDIQLSVSDKMYVSGTEVKYNQTSGGKTYTGSFRPNTSSYESTTTIRVVSQYGNPSWSTRAASTKPTYASIPSGVTNSILYTVTNKDYIPSRVTLSFRGQVASYYATTTTATITFTAAHHFVAGHIVDVSDLGSPMKDVDGIVKITAVPSNTQISYEFKNPLGSSITTTTPSTTSYVNAVVSKYTTIGSSWIDSSVTPNKVWIWDGLRWTSYTEALEDGLVTNDGIAPAPPTDLSMTSLGYAEEGVLGKVSKSSVALSWTAPTTNATGGSLNDLAGYRIWYSTTSSTGPWIGKQSFGQETSQTIIGLTPELTHYFKVIAYDSYGLDSTGLGGSILTEKTALSVEKPSAPTLTTRLGTIKATWDGKDYTNTDTPLSILAYVEVHYSTSTGFTPSESTLLGKIYGGKGFIVATDLEYNTDYYFKFVAVDINKRATASSTQATAKVVPLVDADLIAAKINAPLSSWPFAPKAVTAGALADGSLDASTVFGPGVIDRNAIAVDAIGADQIASNAITAGKIISGAITTAKLDALAVNADKLAANAVTADKILAGTITATQINADSVAAATVTSTTVTSSVMSGSKYIEFNNPATGGGDIVRLGYSNIEQLENSPGVAISSNGTYTGWLGAWGGGDLEMSTDYYNCYIDMFRSDDSIVIRGGGGVQISADPILGSSTRTDMNFTAARHYFDGPITIDANVQPNWYASTVALRITGYGMNGDYLASFNGDTDNTHTGYTRLTIEPNGTTRQALRVNGVIACYTPIVNLSSRTLKEEISPEPLDYFDALLSTQVMKFKYKKTRPNQEDPGFQTGVIAEDVYDSGLHQVVTFDDDKTTVSGVDYSKFGLLLIPIVKELRDKVSALEALVGKE